MPTSETAASGAAEAVKVCTACGQGKPLTDYFGLYTDARTGQQKWKSPCKACSAEREAAHPKGPT